MKFFRVKFTTRYNLSPFGEVSDLLEASKELDIDLNFQSGGWNKGEKGVCFHIWKSPSDPEIVRDFLRSHYRKSLIDIQLDDNFPSTQPIGHFPQNP
jgi:hypothetical protein